jgi:hypothetical protein
MQCVRRHSQLLKEVVKKQLAEEKAHPKLPTETPSLVEMPPARREAAYYYGMRTQGRDKTMCRICSRGYEMELSPASSH